MLKPLLLLEDTVDYVKSTQRELHYPVYFFTVSLRVSYATHARFGPITLIIQVLLAQYVIITPA